MKPLQFYQNKTALDWKRHMACKNITGLEFELKSIRKKCPLTDKPLGSTSTYNFSSHTKLDYTLTRLLVWYYTLLFSPEAIRTKSIRNIDDNDNVSRDTVADYIKQGGTKFTGGLVDLEWLFPTPDPITIHPSTNFILLPIPIPTYAEFTTTWHGYPTITYNDYEAKEFVHQTDHSKDNKFVEHERNIPTTQNVLNNPHMNSLVKDNLLSLPLDLSCKLWTYKYHDISATTKKQLNINGPYSMTDLNPADIFGKTVKKKFTFLEITPYKDYATSYIGKEKYVTTKTDNDGNTILTNNGKHISSIRLKEYSKIIGPLHIKPSWFGFQTYLDKSNGEDFAPCIYDYRVNNIYMNQFSAIEIRGAIKKLQDTIKFNPNKLQPC